jgi:predicted PurR-regulated permease PerM
MTHDFIIKLEKWAIWLSVLGILYLLRGLFPALFLTFVLSYIGNSAVNAMTRRLPYRRVNLAIFYALLLTLIAGLSTLVVPRILLEASALAKQLITTEFSEEETAQVQEDQRRERDKVRHTVIGREITNLVDRKLIDLVGDETFDTFSRSEVYRSLVGQIEATVGQLGPRITVGVRQFVNGMFDVTFQFALSLIFSFLVIWDLPRIRSGLASLAQGRTAEVYAEISPGMHAFGTVLGRAFEAQTIVALVNTLLSTITFVILGIPLIALLGTIVFFCSYIPIVGMMLSTLPAAVLAFKVGGFGLVLWLVVAIAIIHAIEAYALNPLIYGRHLRLHPLLVLAILMVAERLFGVWGLLLGVPVTAFVIKFVIQGEAPPEVVETPAA